MGVFVFPKKEGTGENTLVVTVLEKVVNFSTESYKPV